MAEYRISRSTFRKDRQWYVWATIGVRNNPNDIGHVVAFKAYGNGGAKATIKDKIVFNTAISATAYFQKVRDGKINDGYELEPLKSGVWCDYEMAAKDVAFLFDDVICTIADRSGRFLFAEIANELTSLHKPVSYNPPKTDEDGPFSGVSVQAPAAGLVAASNGIANQWPSDKQNFNESTSYRIEPYVIVTPPDPFEGLDLFVGSF